jgi:hypothetical protein
MGVCVQKELTLLVIQWIIGHFAVIQNIEWVCVFNFCCVCGLFVVLERG